MEYTHDELTLGSVYIYFPCISLYFKEERLAGWVFFLVKAKQCQWILAVLMSLAAFSPKE